MLTPVALVEKARREQPLQVFRQVVLAGYELARGDKENAERHAESARTLCALDFGEGPRSLDQIVQEALEKGVVVDKS